MAHRPIITLTTDFGLNDHFVGTVKGVILGIAPEVEIVDICHSVQPGKNMVGPSLFGVVGRKTGSVPGFHYSPANQNANLTWDPATLDKYLQSPRTVIPGTTMTYGGLKDDTKRSDLIAYLATLK